MYPISSLFTQFTPQYALTCLEIGFQGSLLLWLGVEVRAEIKRIIGDRGDFGMAHKS